jgi:hypothetical protein
MQGHVQSVRVDTIVGPHEIGVMMAIFLFGLVTIQAFTYFQNYPEDSRGTKILVRVLFDVDDTYHTYQGDVGGLHLVCKMD